VCLYNVHHSFQKQKSSSDICIFEVNSYLSLYWQLFHGSTIHWINVFKTAQLQWWSSLLGFQLSVSTRLNTTIFSFFSWMQIKRELNCHVSLKLLLKYIWPHIQEKFGSFIQNDKKLLKITPAFLQDRHLQKID
jgi:hypothetical protein